MFLAGDDPRRSLRVGELDEEMVFESRTGDVFVLGASSWRIEEISHDRVIVTPAPGQPGKMPFWHGDRPGRPREFGEAIGELSRTLAAAKPKDAVKRLQEEHGLDRRAAANLVAYLGEQAEATGEVPSDRTVVVERYRDEIGDWRVRALAVGARVHATWATRSWPAKGIVGASGGNCRSRDGLPAESGAARGSFTAGRDESRKRRRKPDRLALPARFRENAARALLLRGAIRAEQQLGRKQAVADLLAAPRGRVFQIHPRRSGSPARRLISGPGRDPRSKRPAESVS